MRSTGRSTFSRGAVKALSAAALAGVLFATAACSSDSGNPSGGSSPSGSSDDLSYSTPKVDKKLRAMLPDSLKDATTITAGSSLATPPINFTDPTSGDPTGYFVDLANAAGAKLGLEVQWNKQPYPGLIPALQTKKIQLFSPGSPSAETLKVIDVAAITQRSSALLVPKGNPKKIEKPTDACGLNISYTAGSVLDEQIAELIAKDCTDAGKTAPKIENYPSAADAQTAVRSGRSDGMVEPDVVAIYTAKTTDLYYAALLGEFDSDEQGLGFLKEDQQLASAFVAAVKSLQKDGIYEKILKKYGLEKVASIDDPKLITGE